MTSHIHIYTAPFQKATRFVDRCGKKPMWFKTPGNRLLCANSCCRQMRPAKNLLVQVFYDKFQFSCAKGKGCRK